MHTQEPVSVAVRGRVKTVAVVAHGKQKRTIRQLKLDLRFGAPGMLDKVVDALLENQKDLASDVGSQSYVCLVIGRYESKGNVAGCKSVAREPPHPVNQIAQMIFFWIYCP